MYTSTRLSLWSFRFSSPLRLSKFTTQYRPAVKPALFARNAPKMATTVQLAEMTTPSSWGQSSLTSWTPLSAMAIVGALVFALGITGITEASITRSRRVPSTLSRPSTTA
ncbi:hypothetical protein TYRP_011597 [Tyrophagus putrescentiae]|nr:hypothetical protein TYRP_011597 [Tyrophagus putrescentiae]